MKKTILAFLSLLTAITSFSQQPKEKTLLWKISGNNISTPSYLYGTFHLLCPTDFNMPDTVKQLFATTKQLYLEIDIDDPSLNTKMMKGIKMKDNKTLKDFISEKDYDSIAKIFQAKTKIPLSAVNSYKPFILSSMLYPSMLGCAPIAFEKEFEKMAKSAKMEVLGLETIEDQMNVFDNIPYDVQAKMFIKSVYESEKSKEDFFKMVSMYKTKDVRAMHRNVRGDTDLGNFEKILLDKRNKNWIPVIEKIIADKSTFIAVGAGHLAGKNGVIKLLRKQGYKVEAIMY